MGKIIHNSCCTGSAVLFYYLPYNRVHPCEKIIKKKVAATFGDVPLDINNSNDMKNVLYLIINIYTENNIDKL